MKISKFLNESNADKIKMACGYCGYPLDANGDDLDGEGDEFWPPKDYNPRNYPQGGCYNCGKKEKEKQFWEDQQRREEEEQWHREND